MINKTECNLNKDDINNHIIGEAIFHMEQSICYFNDYASLVLTGTEYDYLKEDNRIDFVNKYEIISNDSLSDENNRKLSITFSWEKDGNKFFFDDLYISSTYLDSGDSCIDLSFSDVQISEPLLSKYYEIIVLREKSAISDILNNDTTILKNKHRI